jgi:hypothetical protein
MGRCFLLHHRHNPPPDIHPNHDYLAFALAKSLLVNTTLYHLQLPDIKTALQGLLPPFPLRFFIIQQEFLTIAPLTGAVL